MDTKTPSREPGTRIFARLLSLDLACPSCGEVYKLGSGRPNEGAWDRRTQRWKCDKCGLRLALGLIAYTPTPGRASPAWDQIPSETEAKALARLRQELRNQVDSLWVGGPRGERANRWER